MPDFPNLVLDFIIMFFNSPFGTEYLYNVFKEITK